MTAVRALIGVEAAGEGRPEVTLRGVSKRFANGTLALQRLSLDLRSGEFVSLLGPSGCGKSTALRLIAGLGEPSSGAIEWPHAEYTAEGKPRRKIGFVFQEPTLMPWASAFDNVWLPLRLKHVSRKQAKERVMSALERVRLAKFAHAYPRELSGGMKMRVSIARALITEPSVLLMDEPFAALDEMTRQRLNDDLLALWETFRLTVVFVTHSVTEAVYLSRRIVVMAAQPGRVIADLNNSLAYPRSSATRTSAGFAAVARGVSEILNQSMAGDVDL